MEPIFPIVNMNGDTKETLVKQFGENLIQLNRAIETLSSNMPNGRNYRREEYKQARGQYQEHIDALIDARDYMHDVLDHLNDF